MPSAAPSAATSPILDIFDPDLIRGSEHLPYDPVKAYFYVEHPVEGWRVYLRSGCFIHEAGAHFDAKRFVVVKRTGAHPDSRSWEPPKGQMEGKDGLKHPKTPIMKILEENVRREVDEEAHLSPLRNLRHTGIIYQNVEPDFPPNTFFQYHIFQAYVTPIVINKALEWFAWLEEHPKAFARMKRDRKEKDAIRWFDPKETQMMGRWSPSIVATYIQRMSGKKRS
jgi:8-oxo-dGTP pyrophosphatase MutT (NUDIX family)